MTSAYGWTPDIPLWLDSWRSHMVGFLTSPYGWTPDVPLWLESLYGLLSYPYGWTFRVFVIELQCFTVRLTAQLVFIVNIISIRLELAASEPILYNLHEYNGTWWHTLLRLLRIYCIAIVKEPLLKRPCHEIFNLHFLVTTFYMGPIWAKTVLKTVLRGQRYFIEQFYICMSEY